MVINFVHISTSKQTVFADHITFQSECMPLFKVSLAVISLDWINFARKVVSQYSTCIAAKLHPEQLKSVWENAPHEVKATENGVNW